MGLVALRDMVQLDTMKSLKLIAGERGLDKKVKKIGILDYEFTRRGAAFDSGWDDEFVLTSFLYAEDNQDEVFSAIKRLYKYRAVGIAIRNIFGFEIKQDVIRFANQHDFPIFVMDDFQLFFEDIITTFYKLKDQMKFNELQEKRLVEILHGSQDKSVVKKNALNINCFFGNTYYTYFIKPTNALGEHSLNKILSRGLDKSLEMNGDALIRYKDGAFFIHSHDQSKAPPDVYKYWQVALGLDASRFLTGISNIQPFLHIMRTALLQSYYACCYAELYKYEQCLFKDMGIYQVLFGHSDEYWQEEYLATIMDPIVEYDNKTKSELWKTLLSYELHDGSIKEIAKDMYTHENTVRYRIKKIYDLFNKDANDINFQMELLMAAKLYRIQMLLKSSPSLIL